MTNTTAQELVARLREEGLGFGIGPACLCQEAAQWIEVAIAREAALRDSLVGIRRAAKARRTARNNCEHSYYFYTADAALGDAQ